MYFDRLTLLSLHDHKSISSIKIQKIIKISKNTSVTVDENYEYCTFTQLLTYHVSQEEKIIMIAFAGVLEMLIESRKVI